MVSENGWFAAASSSSNRACVWKKTGGEAGLRVRAVDGGPLEFSASHHTADDLFAARHTYDLKPRGEVILNLDYQQRGLGTASCGPDALERYRITPGRYAWRYVLEPAATN